MLPVRGLRGGLTVFENRTLCCPPKTHKRLLELADLFLIVIGEDHVIWGTDWPFISDVGVTTQALLDATFAWVPDERIRNKILGESLPDVVYVFPWRGCVSSWRGGV